eukprot:TRINITY_DN2045_c0_g1_i1.p1 TRINITY_DN2045_c0_g1~~TRINITY_DN2045_c0_g1_i1.p1  ORF type:complete len:100 (+),score=20.01 TRINITY_DN2045_c0_g1_i1:143-442(+)
MCIRDRSTGILPSAMLDHLFNALGGFLFAAGWWFLVDGAVYGAHHHEDLNIGLYFTVIFTALAGFMCSESQHALSRLQIQHDPVGQHDRRRAGQHRHGR